MRSADAGIQGRLGLEGSALEGKLLDPSSPLSGLDASVSDYVLGLEDTEGFLGKAHDLLEFLIPRYEAEGKSYLTIGIGCTGGRHRSVAIAEELAKRLGAHDALDVDVHHRDVEAEAG